MMEYEEITTTRTYTYLYKIAETSMEEMEIEEGSFYKKITAIMFTAFTLESFLNHIGEEHCEFWNEIEKNRPLEKLKMLYLIFELDYDNSKRPIQSMKALFRIRNQLAHAKTETNKRTYLRDKQNSDEGFLEQLGQAKPNWENELTNKNVKKYFEDMESIVKELYQCTNPIVTNPFSIMVSSSSGPKL